MNNLLIGCAAGVLVAVVGNFLVSRFVGSRRIRTWILASVVNIFATFVVTVWVPWFIAIIIGSALFFLVFKVRK